MFDDVCTFDDDGICKRHKTKHEGRFYKLSQDRTSVGHQYRKIWDKQMAQRYDDKYDDVCEFDESGVCKRHKVKHEGFNYDMSQEKTFRGWRYRQVWDKLMPAKKKDCNCGKKSGDLT